MTMDAKLREAIVTARRQRELTVASKSCRMVDVSAIPGVDRLPRALVVLLENCIRRAASDDDAVRMADRILDAGLSGSTGKEIEFMPARVLFQDFTGVPVFVDFAAMRDAMVARGGDLASVSPRIPCTLIIDHSVIADVAGESDAVEINQAKEAHRNQERFAFLKWAASSFDNVRIVPPGEGICHQLNIERFCEIVSHDALDQGEVPLACFDTLVGTDSHTTTANGVGVLGWGVGGIEAEAAALGQPIAMLVPPVVGLRLTGSLSNGISGMDLALTVAERLRAEGVVGCLVEVFGEGVASLSATQRSCVANMTPEYGATTTLFPVDDRTIEYLRLTGRKEDDLAFMEAYLKAQGVFGEGPERVYSKVIGLDLSSVETSLAGPSRPHRRVSVSGLRERFESEAAAHGHANMEETFDIDIAGHHYALGHGTVAIAAITSCTTATDPAMMVGAGLLAKHALERGLSAKPWVKRILAPGSHATTIMLDRAHLSEPLARLGFYTCGYGCMSCIGNSGEIADDLKAHASSMELTSILSGNRNFDGRISPDVAQNYLCQPALVVVYALTGTLDIDLSRDPVGLDPDGHPVMLSDLMPDDAEINAVLSEVLTTNLFDAGAKTLFEGSAQWKQIKAVPSKCYPWDEDSTYIRRAPYFDNPVSGDHVVIHGARCLALLGDFVTTDHISPAGGIALDSPAARYLESHGVKPEDFNTYGSRRGNHEVMMRGTFANVRLVNAMAEGRIGGYTKDLLDGTIKSIFDAASDYDAHDIPLVVVAGKLYGSGSSRDWAGKGPALLGVRAVLAESFERIHRSNLVQMGVLPLQFQGGQSAASLGLDGTETYDIDDVDLTAGLPAKPMTHVVASSGSGRRCEFDCTVRVDTPMEGAFLAAGGILPYVLGQMLSES